MNVQVPTRRQGMALFLLTILITTLLTCPAFAKKEMQIDSEGDPGDGNLSPSLVSSGGGSAAAWPAAMGVPGFASTKIYIGIWIVPLPGTSLIYPGQVTWFFLRSQDIGSPAASFKLQTGRGARHVR